MRLIRLSLVAGLVAGAAVAAPGAAAPPGYNTDVNIADASADHEEMCLYLRSEEVDSDDPDAEDGEQETITYWAELGRTDFGAPLTMWPPNHKGRPWAMTADQSGEALDDRMSPSTSVTVTIEHSSAVAGGNVDSITAGTATSFYIDNDGETATEGRTATTWEFIPDTEELDARGGVELDFFGEVLAERDGQDRDGRTYQYAFDVDMTFMEDVDGDMVPEAFGGDCVLAAKDGNGGYVADTSDDEYLKDPDEDPQVVSDRRTRPAYVPQGVDVMSGTGPNVGTVGTVTTIEGEAYESFVPHDMRDYRNPNSNAGGKNKG